jgi:hypothetical protein
MSAAPSSAPPPNRTFVKSVLDGSTVVLKTGAVLSLANVEAPRIGNAKEPGREEVRKMIWIL